MEPIQEQQETPAVDPQYQMDHTAMINLMAPMVKGMRETILQQDLYDRLDAIVPNPHPTLTDEQTSEQFVYGMLAHVKYGLSLDEAAGKIIDGSAVKFCFDQFIKSPDFKQATDNMTTVNVNGVDVVHNVDTDNPQAMAEIMKPLFEKFNKELKNNPIVYSKLNYANIKAKQLLKYGERMDPLKGFNIGCAVCAWKFYDEDLQEGIARAMKGEQVKHLFHLFMRETVEQNVSMANVTPAEAVPAQA